MMFERFTAEARTVVRLASEHARRLGHRYIGGEHLLLAVVTVGAPASEVLCAHGLTPELVEEGIVRRVGLGAGAGLFGGLDSEALATIGIDLDAVRARIEASFGERALARAALVVHAGLPERRRLRALWTVSRWRRRRRARRVMTTTPGPPPPEAAGRYCAPGPRPGGPIPFTPVAKKTLELALREAVGRPDPHIGVEHIALVLTTIRHGLVPSILSEADVPVAALRGAILDRYRRASLAHVPPGTARPAPRFARTVTITAAPMAAAPAIPVRLSRSPSSRSARTAPVSGSSRASRAAVLAAAVRRPRKNSV
jgi:hypothetical protein